MKKLLLTLIAAVSALGVHAQWIPQNVPMTFEGYFNDIEVVDANTVWATLDSVNTAAATASGTRKFAKTIDGGATWTIGTVNAAATYLPANICPISADVCYVSMYIATGGGAIFKTIDGGATWAITGAAMFHQASSFTDVVHFFDAANGMAMGDPVGTPLKYEIWTTSDSGTTWVATPPANLPSVTNNAEYGIVNLFAASGDRIWFATTYGDVYRSLDKGLNWTKSASGLPALTGTNGRQDITNIAFSDSLHGIVTQLNGTIITNRITADGGLTWSAVTPTGKVLPEVEGIPGTGVFVSCGSTGSFFGSSFSLDYGASWLTIDDSSHTCIDFINDSTGFSGRYRQVANTDRGAWKFDGKLKAIPCGAPEVNTGIPNVSLANLCLNDTMFFTSPGAVAPTEGVVHGYGVLLSTTDISGLSNPLGTGTILGGSNVISPTTPVNLANNGLIPAGVYYITPVVFGNASNPNSSVDISQFVLDTNCLVTGQSQMITVYASGDPNCTVGLNDHSQKDFTISNVYPVPVRDVLNFTVNAKNSSPVTVSVKDMLGREVYANTTSTLIGENKLSVSVSNFKSGIYVISVTNGKSQSVSKFIKE